MQDNFSWKFTRVSLVIAVCFLLSGISHLAGQTLIIVSSDEREPIPYAVFKSKDGKLGQYANQNARIDKSDLRQIISSSDSVRLSALGFAETIIGSESLARLDSVQLVPIALYFDRLAVITAKKLKAKKVRFRNMPTKPVKSIENDAGTRRVAQYVALPERSFSETEYVVLDAAAFHLQTVIDDSRDAFNVNVYAFDERCSCPGQLLSLKSATRSKATYGWNKAVFAEPVVLSAHRFFVSFELSTPYSANGPNADGHTISYDRGGFPTFRQLFASDEWVEARRYNNRDFYLRLRLRAMYAK